MVSSRRGAVLALMLIVIGASACTSPESGRPPVVSDSSAGRTTEPPDGGVARVTIFHATHFDGAWALGGGQDFARRATLLRRLRAALPEPDHVLVVGNGDDIDPGAGRGAFDDIQFTLESGPDSSGRYAFEAFNAVGLDAETYGFNELAWIERLAPELRHARFAMVSANVRDSTTGEVFGAEYGARPWVVKEVAGVTFGITGALTIDGPVRPPAARVEVVEPGRALTEVVPRMRAAGADIVVVLSHLETRTEAQRIARSVPGIDLILGTHLGDPLQRINGTLLSVREWGVGHLGALDLTIRDGRIADAVLRQYTVEAGETADPEVQRILDRYLPAR